eukprot:m.124979 g.124979  ORF g.124979 m.124979 type:complete len:501 (-) comp9684_c0_seq2:19-1521(-)
MPAATEKTNTSPTISAPSSTASAELSGLMARRLRESDDSLTLTPTQCHAWPMGSMTRDRTNSWSRACALSILEMGFEICRMPRYASFPSGTAAAIPSSGGAGLRRNAVCELAASRHLHFPSVTKHAPSWPRITLQSPASSSSVSVWNCLAVRSSDNAMSSDDCPECRSCPQCQAVPPVARRSHLRRLLARASDTSPSFVETYSYPFDCNRDSLPEFLRPRFILNSYDEGMRDFMQRCEDRSNSCYAHTIDTLGFWLLSPWFCVTTVNGLLKRGRMFVLSQEQFRTHLDFPDPPRPLSFKRQRLMDIGAGDGGVTELLAPMFEEVHVTETNTVMRYRLRQRGFQCFSPEEWVRTTVKYDIITCLNVLDRCDKPITLLSDMRSRLTPKGRIVIALVLPFRPFVENGKEKLPPSEPMIVTGRNFEQWVVSLACDVFLPVGLQIEAFSKTPYLCEGDMNQAYYSLHDGIFVLSACEPLPSILATAPSGAADSRGSTPPPPLESY